MMLVKVAFFVLILSSASGLCPTWYVYDNETEQCVCHSLKKWVICKERERKALLAYGKCMTYDNNTGEINVGRCPYILFSGWHENLQKDGYIKLPENVLDLNDFLCGSWNREGYLCSKCKDGYGMAISNVYMNCVKCKFSKGLGWFLYFVLQLIPITILFFLVLLFRISIVNPPMNAYVTFCQISTALLYSYVDRFFPPFVMDSLFLRRLHYVFLFGLGFWGLDLLENIRGLSDFCVDSKINLQQAVTLIQIKSLFPLLLVAVTYACIELHTRNCNPIVYLWRPFRKCFGSYVKVCNPMVSLVDVFSTFLLLSYSKYVMVLHFIYSFQHTYNISMEQDSKSVLLYNPEVSYYNKRYHLPYALFMLFTLVVVAIPPVIFLALYQTKIFQKFLSCLCLHRLPSIHIFADHFQSCYKDGINGTYDLRFTASLYLILRLSVFLGAIGCNYTSLRNCELIFTFASIFLLLLFYSLVRPYKNQRMNVLDSLLLAGLAIICLLLSGTLRRAEYLHFNLAALVIILMIVGIPQIILFLYLFFILIKYLFKLKCSQRFAKQVQKTFKLKLNITSLSSSCELNESLPDRVDNPYFANEEF